MNCEICGNETFSEDAQLCDDCAAAQPVIKNKTKETLAIVVSETEDLSNLHRCEWTFPETGGTQCLRLTDAKYGTRYLCKDCTILAKNAEGRTETESPRWQQTAQSEPLKTTPSEYDPANFTSMSYEQVFQKIFNEYAPRLADMPDDEILTRILYHKRAQEIDKILEAIVIGEVEKRAKKKTSKAVEDWRNKGDKNFDSKRPFLSGVELEAQEKAEKKEKTQKSKIELHVDRLVKAGMDRAEVRRILGLDK